MKVSSTRGGSEVSLSEAISVGLAPDGGLYTPPSLPAHSGAWGTDLQTRVSTLLRPFFAGEVLEHHLEAIIHEAFTFDAPTKWLADDTGLLELFYGPTAAFKDFGARFLAITGLETLLAETRDDYIRIAANLAADPARLQALRSGLRERMAASTLCRGEVFTPQLEAAYRTWWQRWCEAT